MKNLKMSKISTKSILKKIFKGKSEKEMKKKVKKKKVTKIKKVLVKYYKIKRLNIYLSLADEKDYSISYVIVKKTK